MGGDADEGIRLAPAPPEPTAAGRSGTQSLLRLVAGMGASVLVGVLLAGRQPGLAGAAAVLYGALAIIGLLVAQGGRFTDVRAQQLDAARARFATQLSRAREQARSAAAEQRRQALLRHPDPDALWTVAGSERLWERRPGDDDYALVRAGLGRRPLARPLLVPPATADADPWSASAIERFVRTHNQVTSMPTCIDLRGLDDVWFEGDPDLMRGLMRALLAQTIAWHSPADLRVLVAASPDRAAQWEWLKWSPHVQHPTRTDAAGPVRLFATEAAELSRVAGPGLGTRFGLSTLVVVCDGVDDVVPALLGGESASAVGLHLGAAPPHRGSRGALVELREGRLVLHRGLDAADIDLGVADHLDLAQATQVTRGLAAVRPGTSASGDRARLAQQEREHLAQLGVTDLVGLDGDQLWRHRRFTDRLRVPIGVDLRDRVVSLDLRGPQAGGDGPHGLVVGAHGSGVSELLRTIVVGLALAQPPEQVVMVLADSGSTSRFDEVAELPHVVAAVDDLAQRPDRVVRLREAISGDFDRRRAQLRSAGVATRDEYDALRRSGIALAPMPSLVIVIDGLGELLDASPELVEGLVHLVRTGTPLGVHVLFGGHELAGRQHAEQVLRGLDEWLGHRIALRVDSASESRLVLGTPAAADLPEQPGAGYLRTDAGGAVRFSATCLSRPHVARRPQRMRTEGGVVEFVAGAADSGPRPATGAHLGTADAEPADATDTLLALAVARLAAATVAAPRLWVPRPDAAPGLTGLLELVTPGRLQIPLGLVDRPRQHRVDPLVVDLSGEDGHLVLLGGSVEEGSAAAAGTLVAALALTHTPAEVGCYLLNFGAARLDRLAELPHVGSIAGPGGGDDAGGHDVVRRTVAEMSAALAAREVQFTELGLESMAAYRAGRASGQVPPDRFATDLFLVVDGWAQLHAQCPDLEEPIIHLARVGLDHGVHVVVQAEDAAQLPASLRALMRSIPDERDHGQVLQAVPRRDGRDGVDGLARATSELVAHVRAGWDGPGAAPVRLLPTNVPVAALPAVVNDGIVRRVPFAIDENRLAPVSFDPAREVGFVVTGDARSGRTTTLRLLVQGIQRRYGGGEAKVMLVDLRRGLADAVDAGHDLGSAASVAAVGPLVDDLAEALRVRLPGPQVTQQQLRERSWWRGLDVFLVVDDVDLVEQLSPGVFDPIIELVPHADSIGLHLLLAGRRPDADALDPGSGSGLLAAVRREGCDELVLPSRRPPGRGIWTRAGGHRSAVVQVANAGETTPETASGPLLN